MPESPIITVEELPEALIVHVVADNLDEDQLRQMQSAVRAAVSANPGRPCILDLTRVSFLPSMSLASLIRLHSELKGRGQRLLLAGLQPQVRDVFVVTRLDRLFELHDDLAEAMQAVGRS
jgi:anti-sigma B factor antagonist